jgi:hypothetical protein
MNKYYMFQDPEKRWVFHPNLTLDFHQFAETHLESS